MPLALFGVKEQSNLRWLVVVRVPGGRQEALPRVHTLYSLDRGQPAVRDAGKSNRLADSQRALGRTIPSCES